MATEKKQRSDLSNFLRILAGAFLVGSPGYTAVIALTAGNVGAAVLFIMVAAVFGAVWYKFLWK